MNKYDREIERAEKVMKQAEEDARAATAVHGAALEAHRAAWKRIPAEVRDLYSRLHAQVEKAQRQLDGGPDRGATEEGMVVLRTRLAAHQAALAEAQKLYDLHMEDA